MRIYRIAGLRNPLDLAAIDLGNQIFKYITEMFLEGKIKIGMGYRYPFSPYVEKVKRILKLELIINYHNNYNEKDKNRAVVIEGEYNTIDPKKIKNRKFESEIIIAFYKNFSKDYFNVLYRDLVDKSRHELEHIIQDNGESGSKINYTQEKLKSKDNVERFYERIKYVKNEIEQDSFIRELMLNAKKTRRPIKDILEYFIDKELFKNDPLVEQDIRNKVGDEIERAKTEIRSIYVEKIKKIFPKAQL